MTYPTLIFLALLIWSFTWPKEDLVYLLFGSAAFGSLAVIPTEFVGGINVLPSSLTALVLSARYALSNRFLSTVARDAFRLDRFGLLTAFMGVAVISALFYPRLFAGQLEVIAVRNVRELLGPTTANFTQISYLLVSYFVGLAIFSSARNPAFVQKLINAFLLGGLILIVSGLVDFALGGDGASPVLAAFKTAEYTMMESDIFGARRVVGLMPEPATYGSTCVIYAAVALFSSVLLESARHKLYARLVALGLMVMAILSASSTAYVGLGVLLVLYVADFARRSVGALVPGRGQVLRFLLLSELFILYAALAALGLTFVFAPDVFLTPIAYIDTLIFKKSLGFSYYERMSWNLLAMEALAGTGWVGVGVGGARTSNWFVAILSNTGILGAALLFSFIAMVLFRPAARDPRISGLLVGARASIGVNLIMAALAGTTTDFGVTVGALFGVIAANLPRAAPVPRERTLMRGHNRSRVNRALRVPMLAPGAGPSGSPEADGQPNPVRRAPALGGVRADLPKPARASASAPRLQRASGPRRRTAAPPLAPRTGGEGPGPADDPAKPLK